MPVLTSFHLPSYSKPCTSSDHRVCPAPCVQVKDVGVVLAHGNDASEWKGRLLTEVAGQLARAGQCGWRGLPLELPSGAVR